MSQGDNEDRISALPGDVIDHILGLLPAQDAAKTSILSKNWRYIWRKLPYLVLDYHFESKLSESSQSFFIQTVDSILSLHLGDIVKFVLYVIEQEGSSYDVFDVNDLYRWSSYEDVDTLYEDQDTLYEHVDRWMYQVTGNGIKELTLYLSLSLEGGNIYEVPSCVFNCTTLTRLDLLCCVFKPPNSFLDFPKLETLHLEMINIVPTTEFCLLNVPLLVDLKLSDCDGTQYLHIISPLLEVLYVYEVHYLVLNYFMNCKKLRELHLSLFNMVGKTNRDEQSTVEKLLVSLAPTLEKLDLTSSILELLNAGTIPRGTFFMLSCLRDISTNVHFGKFSQTSGLLQLITSIPNLSKLEITVDGTKTGANAVEKYKKYLKSPACPDQFLKKLKHVVICWFQGSKIELLFMKLLFARSPTLVRMSVMDARPPYESSIPRELKSCPKASPNAELHFLS